MTDEQIIKALECCKYEYDTKCELCCYNFYSRTGCRSELRRNALNLINRQQAEIERLKIDNKILSINADNAFQEGLNESQDLYAEQIKKQVKSEAIKEFAERFKMNITINNTNDGYLDYSVDYNCLMEDIDDVVKEMVGEE